MTTTTIGMGIQLVRSISSFSSTSCNCSFSILPYCLEINNNNRKMKMKMKMKRSLSCTRNIINNFPLLPPPILPIVSVRAINSKQPPPNQIVHRRNFFFTTSCSSSSSSSVVIASEDSHDNNKKKEVISLTPQLYTYLLANVREPPILKQLRQETSTMPGSQMQVSPDQAQLLAMLVQILGAQRCIELGVYTGYSSLAVALVLPESGRLVACERDGKSLEIAKKYYELAGVSHKMDVRHELAVDALKSLIRNGEACSYDFAFVDAEKRMYTEYFELLLQLVRVGGLIVIDNVLWHGKVADPLVNDPKTVSIRNFNRHIMEDKRVSISMVPVGDGMTICRKR